MVDKTDGTDGTSGIDNDRIFPILTAFQAASEIFNAYNFLIDVNLDLGDSGQGIVYKKLVEYFDSQRSKKPPRVILRRDILTACPPIVRRTAKSTMPPVKYHGWKGSR